jgi:hypothetical protein
MKPRCQLTPSSILLLVPALAIAAPEPPPTLLAKPVSVAFVDDMTVDAKTEIKWRQAKGKWTRSSSEVVVAEIESDKHGAVGRVPVKLTNFVLAVDVRLDGAKSATISINDEKEHVARVGLSANGFFVRKDDHDHDGPDRPVQFYSSPEKVESGQWHTVVLEMVGDTMVATLDGKITGWGTDGLFKASKANPGLTVAGESAAFRNFRIWEAASEPQEGWSARREKLPAPNLKPQEAPAQKKKPAAK